MRKIILLLGCLLLVACSTTDNKPTQNDLFEQVEPSTSLTVDGEVRVDFDLSR